MASSAASLLRLCLRPSRQLPGLRAAAAAARQTAAARQATLRSSSRPFSVSTAQWARETSEDGAPAEGGVDDPAADNTPTYKNPGEYLTAFLEQEDISDEDRQAATHALRNWENMPRDEARKFEKLLVDLDEDAVSLRRPVVPKKDSFWHDDEADPDLITDEVGEDDFEEDDILAMGHAKLEEHREMREYARLAVWEMPLLSSKPA